MNDYNRKNVNPLLVGLAAAAGALAAMFLSKPENREKAKKVAKDLKDKAEDLMHQASEKIQETKEEMPEKMEEIKRRAGRRRIMQDDEEETMP